MKTITLCNDPRLRPIIGDIKDIDSVKYALKDVDTVMHLAAMKHIDLCEANPSEAININVNGTKNLLDNFKGKKFIAMSTDKAVEPLGCYGATKLLMEKLVLERARSDTSKKYSIVRSGNIFGSSGSVIEKWQQQIKNNNKITITDPEMTRFFTDVDSLVRFMISVLENSESEKIYIPYQKVIKLKDLAHCVIDLFGDANTKIEVMGLRKGERPDEKLFFDGEKVVTDLNIGYSRDADMMSLEDIKGLLNSMRS
jgi:FlaA1/EpsC-like NDP-sugar epimerase